MIYGGTGWLLTGFVSTNEESGELLSWLLCTSQKVKLMAVEAIVLLLLYRDIWRTVIHHGGRQREVSPEERVTGGIEISGDGKYRSGNVLLTYYNKGRVACSGVKPWTMPSFIQLRKGRHILLEVSIVWIQKKQKLEMEMLGSEVSRQAMIRFLTHLVGHQTYPQMYKSPLIKRRTPLLSSCLQAATSGDWTTNKLFKNGHLTY